MLSLCRINGKEFAKAKVLWTKETAFGNLSKEDKEGHEKFSCEDEMYKTYSEYYKTKVAPETKVKIIKFMLIS